MLRCLRQLAVVGLCLLVCAAGGGCAHDLVALVIPEQRSLNLREPGELPPAPIPQVPPPPTVSDPQTGNPERYLTLDEAIQIALANSQVVRVLAGVTAVSSGRTIYDPAITNTTIDRERGTFDPSLDLQNNFNRTEPPRAFFDPFDLTGTSIDAVRTDAYDLSAGLSKKLATGGTLNLGVTDTLSKFKPGVFPLDPQNQHALTLSFTQPLLQGAGLGPNLAPIVIARINTERSYFQFKESLQESVRGVIEAYWALVFARTDAWVRRQQVEWLDFLYRRAKAEFDVGRASRGVMAQAKTSLANFKGTLVSAEANVLQREAALRNILGLPPSDTTRLIPVTPPFTRRLEVHWEKLLQLAEENRPDLIERKLTIEADEQRLMLARNQALPRVEAVALYRWNGLAGRTPTRDHISTAGGQFTDWTLGLSCSLPLCLRTNRATLREQELNLLRDRANLKQSLHAAIHELAESTRNLAQFYEQYQMFQEAREAARVNLEQQRATLLANLNPTIYLVLLQAITDWGNALSAEAQSLTQYNTELATLEKQTGTILETHGIELYEERFVSRGPLGLKHRSYPQSMPPGQNMPRYPAGAEPAENIFDLKSPLPASSQPQEAPPPRPLPRGNREPALLPPPHAILLRPR